MKIKKASVINFIISLRMKIGLSIFLLLFVIGVIVGNLFILQKGSVLEKGLKEQGTAIINMFANQSAQAIKNKDDLALLSYVHTLREQSGVVYAAVLDTKGKVLAHTVTSKIGTNPGVQVGRADEILTHPLLLERKRIGTVYLGLSRESIDSLIAQTRRNVWTVIIISSVIIGLIFFILTNYLVTKPLQSIKDDIPLIAKGDLEPRIDIHTRDEIARLAKAISSAFKLTREREETYLNRIGDRNQEENERIKNLLEITSKDKGIILTESHHNIIFLNSKAEEILGKERKEVIGSHIIGIIKDHTFLDLLKKALNQPEKMVEGKINLANKSFKTVITTVKNTEGELINVIVGLS